MEINEKYLYEHIGKKIKEARIKLGLKQHDLADFLGIVRNSIVNLEAGNQRTPLPTLYKICAGLGIDIYDLILPMDTIVQDAQVIKPLREALRIQQLEDKIAALEAEREKLLNGGRNAS